jgi:hypothetical protein
MPATGIMVITLEGTITDAGKIGTSHILEGRITRMNTTPTN